MVLTLSGEKENNKNDPWIKFSFPKEFNETSKYLLIKEIASRFDKIYYQNKSYISSGWSIMKDININHHEYAIRINL